MTSALRFQVVLKFMSKTVLVETVMFVHFSNNILKKGGLRQYPHQEIINIANQAVCSTDLLIGNLTPISTNKYKL